MSHDTLTAIPEQIVAGTTVKFRRTYGHYPASAGWALSLYLAGASVLSENGVADGDSFNFTLTNAETGALTPGNYNWQERATLAGETYVADFGVLEVLPNLAAATAGSLQSFNAKLLAAVEASLNLRFGVGAASAIDVVEEYTIHGRSLKKFSTAELLDLRSRLRQIVRSEANPGRLGPKVLVTFTGVDQEDGNPWNT